MSRDETQEDRTGTSGAPSRALVVLSGSAPAVAARPRPLSAFLAQLATSDAPRPARALRAPEAARRYAEASRLG
jgi:hypothetical protein